VSHFFSAQELATKLQNERGVLLALPGTVQQRSGWYETVTKTSAGKSQRMALQFAVDEETGAWAMVHKPIPIVQYLELIRKERTVKAIEEQDMKAKQAVKEEQATTRAMIECAPMKQWKKLRVALVLMKLRKEVAGRVSVEGATEGGDSSPVPAVLNSPHGKQLLERVDSQLAGYRQSQSSHTREGQSSDTKTGVEEGGSKEEAQGDHNAQSPSSAAISKHKAERRSTVRAKGDEDGERDRQIDSLLLKLDAVRWIASPDSRRSLGASVTSGNAADESLEESLGEGSMERSMERDLYDIDLVDDVDFDLDDIDSQLALLHSHAAFSHQGPAQGTDGSQRDEDHEDQADADRRRVRPTLHVATKTPDGSSWGEESLIPSGRSVSTALLGSLSPRKVGAAPTAQGPLTPRRARAASIDSPRRLRSAIAVAPGW
jgi:hypothetical protein